jgi:hypothetical protein
VGCFDEVIAYGRQTKTFATRLPSHFDNNRSQGGALADAQVCERRWSSRGSLLENDEGKEAAMSNTNNLFVHSRPLEPGARYGVLSGFDPGTRTLPAGYRLAPAFQSLRVDIVFEKDVASRSVTA